jgi:hypothetical protein
MGKVSNAGQAKLAQKIPFGIGNRRRKEEEEGAWN